MGQYHLIANLDKREFIESNGGDKLMEFCYQDQGIALELENLMKNEWKDDHLYVIGDYCDLDSLRNYNVRGYYNLRELYQRYDYLRNVDSIFTYIRDNFKQIKWDIKNYSAENSRYLINTEANEYVDLANCPIQFVWFNGKLISQRIHPLFLLLSLSNGLGGGDYFGDDKYVCYWGEFSNSITFSNEKPKGLTLVEAEFIEKEDYETTKETLAKAIVKIYESRERNGKTLDIDSLELVDHFVEPETFEEAKQLAKIACILVK